MISFIGDLSTLSFWYYYFFINGYERELCIYSYYKDAPFYSMFLGICLYFATNLNPVMIIAICLSNTVLQCYLGYPYFKRYYEAKVEARKAKADEWIKRIEKIVDFLKELEDKFEDTPEKEFVEPEQEETEMKMHNKEKQKQEAAHPIHIVRILKVFELPITTDDFGVIKSRFRQLVQKHHPDKGGDNQMTARLINDYRILEEHFLKGGMDTVA
ncbi:hypothetical protein ACFWMP_19390 [Paenibacillus sp. NPDC058367]|uniref:hypothetical protein n=1 Tax=Paenibacillus sp. NPDC058367 TaxID=3346460 RepID=UPI00365B4771